MPGLLQQPATPKTQADIQQLLTQKWYAEFNVASPAKPQATLIISSCNGYFAHNQDGLQTLKHNEAAAFMEIAMMCNATMVISLAKPAQSNLLDALPFDAALPAKLPKDAAMLVSTTERDQVNKDNTKKYWRDVNVITKFESAGEGHALYYHAGGYQELERVASGDFNSDGIQDLLVTSRDFVDGGSYSAIRLLLLTKTPVNPDIVLLKEYGF